MVQEMFETQEMFDKKMEMVCNASSPRVAVVQAMRMAYYHPDLAKVWFEKLPKATLDNL